MDIINNNTNEPRIFKIKKIKIPRKAKVNKGKIKKGWVGIIKVDENGNISGEKTKLLGSTFSLKDGNLHATDGTELLYWEGKFPVFVQESKSLNPKRFNSGENQTYGQKYVKARMLADTIKVKKGFNGGIIIWIIVAVALFFGVKYIFKF
jgi:hypothetical protein